MSEQIRRKRIKTFNLDEIDPLKILEPNLVKMLKKLSKDNREEIRAFSAMPYFCKHFFNKDLYVDKINAALSDSERRVIIGGRRIGKTEFIALDVVYKLLTNSDQKIAVVAPDKYHIKEIFNRVRHYLRSDRNLESGLRRNISSSRFEIVYNNGSRIRGFTLGKYNRSATNSGRYALRGQDADYLYVDEFTYCNKANYG